MAAIAKQTSPCWCERPLRLSYHLSFTLFVFLFQKTFSERVKQFTLGLTPEHVHVSKSPDLLLDEGQSPEPESTVHTPVPADPVLRLTIGLPSDGEDDVAEEGEGLAPEYLTGRELEDEDEDEEPSCAYEKRVNATVQLAQDETLQGYRCRSTGENE